MEESTSLHTECAHKPHPAVLNQFSRTGSRGRWNTGSDR